MKNAGTTQNNWKYFFSNIKYAYFCERFWCSKKDGQFRLHTQ